MTEQARDNDGKFAAGGHTAEQAAREGKRYAVKIHADRSVGTHTGKMVLGNLAKAALGTALGVAGTLTSSALRAQSRGGRR
jgi:hypothetical protein